MIPSLRPGCTCKARDAVSPACPGPRWLVDALAVWPVYIGEDRGQVLGADAVEVQVQLLLRCWQRSCGLGGRFGLAKGPGICPRALGDLD